jgi:hypothetical protein
VIGSSYFYLQQNTLHLNTQDQGHLVFLNAGGGMLAAALYGFFAARRLPLRTLLRVCLLFSAAMRCTGRRAASICLPMQK